jgi:MoxR-like ATPase
MSVSPSEAPGSAPVAPTSVEAVAAGLRSVGYLPGESTALVSYLASKLGKPVLVEGPAGVGKTELAKSLA